MKIKNKREKIIFLIVFFIIIIFMINIIGILYEKSNDADSEKVKKHMEDNLINDDNKFNELDENEEYTNVLFDTERISKLKELQDQNNDIVGWLEIPNTNISYPILQGFDNSYYMNHNYKKRFSKNGSLFLDKAYDWNKPSENLLIYGHNNRGTDEMFVELLKYKEESFYKEHPIIRFTTAKEDAIYEIISAFLSRVYYKRESNVFRYYYFINAEKEEDFDYYVSESKKASLYNIETTAEYGDQLITLSTCDYSQKDGRFVVVARKK